MTMNRGVQGFGLIVQDENSQNETNLHCQEVDGVGVICQGNPVAPTQRRSSIGGWFMEGSECHVTSNLPTDLGKIQSDNMGSEPTENDLNENKEKCSYKKKSFFKRAFKGKLRKESLVEEFTAKDGYDLISRDSGHDQNGSDASTLSMHSDMGFHTNNFLKSLEDHPISPKRMFSPVTEESGYKVPFIGGGRRHSVAISGGWMAVTESTNLHKGLDISKSSSLQRSPTHLKGSLSSKKSSVSGSGSFYSSNLDVYSAQRRLSEASVETYSGSDRSQTNSPVVGRRSTRHWSLFADKRVSDQSASEVTESDKTPKKKKKSKTKNQRMKMAQSVDILNDFGENSDIEETDYLSKSMTATSLKAQKENKKSGFKKVVSKFLLKRKKKDSDKSEWAKAYGEEEEEKKVAPDGTAHVWCNTESIVGEPGPKQGTQKTKQSKKSKKVKKRKKSDDGNVEIECVDESGEVRTTSLRKTQSGYLDLPALGSDNQSDDSNPEPKSDKDSKKSKKVKKESKKVAKESKKSKKTRSGSIPVIVVSGDESDSVKRSSQDIEGDTRRSVCESSDFPHSEEDTPSIGTSNLASSIDNLSTRKKPKGSKKLSESSMVMMTKDLSNSSTALANKDLSKSSKFMTTKEHTESDSERGDHPEFMASPKKKRGFFRRMFSRESENEPPNGESFDLALSSKQHLGTVMAVNKWKKKVLSKGQKTTKVEELNLNNNSDEYVEMSSERMEKLELVDMVVDDPKVLVRDAIHVGMTGLDSQAPRSPGRSLREQRINNIQKTATLFTAVNKWRAMLKTKEEGKDGGVSDGEVLPVATAWLENNANPARENADMPQKSPRLQPMKSPQRPRAKTYSVSYPGFLDSDNMDFWQDSEETNQDGQGEVLDFSSSFSRSDRPLTPQIRYAQKEKFKRPIADFQHGAAQVKDKRELNNDEDEIDGATRTMVDGATRTMVYENKDGGHNIKKVPKDLEDEYLKAASAVHKEVNCHNLQNVVLADSLPTVTVENTDTNLINNCVGNCEENDINQKQLKVSNVALQGASSSTEPSDALSQSIGSDMSDDVFWDRSRHNSRFSDTDSFCRSCDTV